MPIYAYKCSACGHTQDALQKISDPPLTVCPACGQSTYAKQLTAPQFQLKGSGWYVTDFRGGSKGEGAKAEAGAKGETKSDAPADSKAAAKSESKTESSGETKTSAPAATPAGGAPSTPAT